MSEILLRNLGKKLRALPVDGKLPKTDEERSLYNGEHEEWLFEGLGQLWFYWELGLEKEAWLVEGCFLQWQKLGGRMEDLVGYSRQGLPSVGLGELCDLLMMTWTLERSLVGGLFAEMSPEPAPLEYGIREVLAEIRSRPLVEPPLPGYYEDFYLMTHVVYLLNCFNGHLPNCRSDAPWLYSYLERCLGFWLREGKHKAKAKPGGKSNSSSVQAESVDAVAEAVDVLRGLGLGDDDTPGSELVREGFAWLLERQAEDGFFYSPGERQPKNHYDRLHPTWTSAAALQLDRQAPGPSKLCEAWSKYARQIAKEINFAEPPPAAKVKALGSIPEHASPASGYP
eukprot:TRINITY_DN66092_c0_g1_i1.p1 TRINITY_DN66092_c0_g1~~TRINITY_DN66092_c0_g1_i1.p1  ORF type:complete len:364 (-),score=70.06 TRINITY_DN66092_c0_g1_i1:102-1121(-)